MFLLCFSVIVFIMLKSGVIFINSVVLFVPFALFTNKFPGTYKSTSRESLRYRFLRDVFVLLNGLSFAMYRTNQSLINLIVVFVFLALGVFFYHQYLQCNQEFIEEKGKFFLLSLLTTIVATFSLVIAVYDFFWRSKYTSSIMVFILGIICVGLAIIFSRKNIEYLSQNRILNK